MPFFLMSFDIFSFVWFLYVNSMSSLGEQGKAKKRYKKLTNLQKRLFYHFRKMRVESEKLPFDPESSLHKKSGMCWLNAFCPLVKSVGRIISGGCWIVKKDAYYLTNGRVACAFIYHFSDTVFIARVVCALNYGIFAIKSQHASHLCNNSECVNPGHIYPDTPTANIVDRAEGFKIGSVKICMSLLPCKFVRGGAPLLCRNDSRLDDCICEMECFREGKSLE